MLKDRIRGIRQKLNLTQVEFSQKLKISQGQVSTYERGEGEIPTSAIIKIAKLGGVSLDWLITGEESKYTPPLTDVNNLQSTAKIVGSNLYPIINKIAGDFSFMVHEENIAGYLNIKYHRRDKMFLVEVTDDTMDNQTQRGIRQGDYALVDTITKPLSGDIIVLLIDERQLIKQYIETKDDKIELRSWNSSSPPIYLKKEDIKVFYRVCLIQPKPRSI